MSVFTLPCLNISLLLVLTHFVPVLQDDPFWTVRTLSRQEKDLIANQSVCSLVQLLKLASYHNSTVVFRLRRPPPEHPCYDSWINDTLQAVQQSGVPQSLVRVLESHVNIGPISIICILSLTAAVWLKM